MNPFAQLLLSTLNKEGETRIVGGAVRDLVLQIPPKDYDFATTLLPKAVMKIARKNGWQPIPIGIEFGTVKVVIQEQVFEVTTLREDIETDGRHAKVKFGKSFEQDALRRDFTINALSQDVNGKIYDYYNGIEDLKHKHVRFIGNAESRIEEDYLRILRFFRFSARFSPNRCDKQALKAIISHKSGLKFLKPERIQAEFLKLLACENPYAILKIMSNAGILLEIFAKVADFTPINHNDPILRLAALFISTHQDALDLREALKLSNADKRRLENIAEGWFKTRDLSENQAKAMLYMSGKRSFIDRISIGEARFMKNLTQFRTLANEWHIPTFPITGEQLKAKGFIEGKDMGEELLRLKNIWLQNGCKF